MTERKAHVWEEKVVIPTYRPAAPEKNPLFLEHRAYQGSTGKVYPLPVTEKISDVKEDVTYHAVWLENDYLKVMILPELGGRIQRALDKTNNYDFIYYNRVIKPALVGLTGPWISGGIEFNWPQHHRPSTDLPVDYCLKENPDGSATVFVGEIDRMYGTKGMASFTLYPDRAYIEIRGQLFNPTSLPQTFLWWANPAVSVNDHTYSVFPPDVTAVMDHGKRAVSTFPIATGEYYKYDYSAGVDISCYRNIEVPTSYMAAKSDYDFIGNFDEQVDAGLLHVADHHISPGKKQWTWGCSDFGRAWDRNLTDEDGPYIELMTGVFADNQPDFTWLKPGEEKSFVQYFMPYKHVGRVKNATKDAAVGLQLEEVRYSEAADRDSSCAEKTYRGVVRVYATGSYPSARITVKKQQMMLFEGTADLDPESPWEAYFPAESLTDCIVTVTAADGHVLVTYTEQESPLEPVPDPAEVMPAPSEIGSTEELYLAGEHLEQYRHANYAPEDYYEEGLRRDPGDIRLNNRMGLLQLRRGNFARSIGYFRRAIRRQTKLTPNPYSGECFFNLGLALVMTGETEEAFDAFYKSTWSSETQSVGFYWLACLSARRGEWEKALEFADRSLLRGWHNMKTRTLKAAILRKLGRPDAAYLKECREIDPLYMGILYEQAMAEEELSAWQKMMRTPAHNYLTLSLSYMEAGLYEDAVRILSCSHENSPLIFAYKGYALKKLAEDSPAGFRNPEKADQNCMVQAESWNVAAAEAWRAAEAMEPGCCFPNRIEDIIILTAGLTALDHAPHLHYYLGCLLYDQKQAKSAISHWETAVKEDPEFAMAWRNLAIAAYNKEQDLPKAEECMRKAFELDPGCTRYLQEYDQLLARAGRPIEERLALMEQNMAQVEDRDILTLEYITLLNSTGQYRKALDLIMGRRFHPWEGGEGKVSTQYRYALSQMAKEKLAAGAYEEAVSLLEQYKIYPENLGEGKLPGVQDNVADYWLGCAYEKLGCRDKAENHFREASTGLDEPSGVLYYNDQPSDTIFYQGLACRKLGDEAGAKRCFHQLLAFGRRHIFDKVGYDYFAVSLPEIEIFPEPVQSRNDRYCHYLMGLGYLGLGEQERAGEEFDRILQEAPDYQGAICHRGWEDEVRVSAVTL